MIWTKKNANRNVTTYVVFNTLMSADFSRSLFVVYLGTIGLSNTTIGFLQATLFITVFLFEIPLGIFADVTKRKYSLLAGAAALALAFLVFPSSEKPIVLYGVFFLLGIGFSLLSGAGSALLFDGLQQAGSDWSDKYAKIVSISRSLGTACMAIALWVSGYMYEASPASIFYITSTFMLTGFFVCLFIDEGRSISLDNLSGCQNKSPVISAISFLRSKTGKHLLLFILSMAFIEALHTPFFIFSQTLFKSAGFQPVEISRIISLGFVAGVFVNYFAGLVKVKRLIFSIIVLVTVLTGFLIGMVFIHTKPYVIIAFFVVQLLPTALFIHTDTYIHGACESEIRATFISIQSFTNAIFISASYALIGMLSDKAGQFVAISLIGSIMLLLSAVSAVFFRMQMDLDESCSDERIEAKV